MRDFLDRVIKYSIYLLVFLTPLFFLPFSFEKFEFNKQYLLFFLTAIAFFTWLAEQILVEKEIKFRKTPLDIPVLIFLFIAILSAIFSIDKYSSLLGFYGRFSDGLIGLLSLVMLYFLIVNNTRNRRETERETDAKLISPNSLIKVFLLSVFFVILITYFSIFGLWDSIFRNFNISSPLLEKNFNPVAGSLEGLAMFLSVVVVLLVGLYLQRTSIINYLLLVGAMGLLLVIDFSGAWLTLILSLSIFTIFALRKRLFKDKATKILLPMILIVIAGISLIINYQLLIINYQLPSVSEGGEEESLLYLPREQILGQGTSFEIGVATLTDNIKNSLLGSGMGTFFYDFSKEKTAQFNQTLFWQMRYDRPGNHVAEILSTMGVLGFLSYFFIIGIFLLISWILMNTDKKLMNTDTQISGIPLLMAFVALVVGQFFYYQNTVLAFTFWLILGLSAGSWDALIKEKTFSFKKFPELNLVFRVFVMLVGLIVLGAGFFGQKIYRADMIFAQAETTSSSSERTKLIEKAVKLNPQLAYYRNILARAYLTEVLDEMRKPSVQQDSIKIQNNIAKAIDTAKIASEISPNNIVNWETLGIVYREIRALAAGALEWGIKSFTRAIELEPVNPVLHTELGKLYLVAGENQKAKTEIEKALALKPDYVDAQIQIALLAEKEGKTEEAIKKMEKLVDLYPLNTDILFQLGRLYYNNEKTQEAISVLERVIKVQPNHSNALYSLGVIYSKKGEKQKAIQYFEKVLELNPGNVDIQQKIKELKE